nr:MAG TPA: hypothetical protein [Bacteriophage sp.]DAU51067.1 MAG TPA: hypothetical protein [Caudoviricetes sp.]
MRYLCRIDGIEGPFGAAVDCIMQLTVVPFLFVLEVSQWRYINRPIFSRLPSRAWVAAWWM